jgi:DNA-binding NtrC family response regulator
MSVMPEPPVPPVPPSDGLADPRTKMVLIVDDDETLLNLLEILVRRDGFEVVLAENAEVALQKLSRKPHAILLDLVLPGSSGLEVLKHLHTLPPPTPAVVVVTGHEPGHAMVKEAAKDPFVNDFCFKPINQEKLLGQLHRLLRTRAPVRKAPQAPKGTGA